MPVVEAWFHFCLVGYHTSVQYYVLNSKFVVS